MTPPDGAPTPSIGISPGRDADIERLQVVCTETAIGRSEGTDKFIELPKLHIRVRGAERVVDALLCLNQRDGYSTKLYLSEPVCDLGGPWSNFYILGRNWFSWSWKDVPANQSPIAILAGHLEAFR